MKYHWKCSIVLTLPAVLLAAACGSGAHESSPSESDAGAAAVDVSCLGHVGAGG